MKMMLTLLAAAALLLPAPDKTPQEKYIEKFAPLAVEEMQRSGIPASVTLAQAFLESRYGESELASEFNNHFGIKCHNDWKGARTYYDDNVKGECFRVYSDASESFRDHSDFLRYQDRYKSLFDLKITDYKGWARGLKAAGYATDPSYAVKLIQIIEEYDLTKYDGGLQKDSEKTVKPSPHALETPRELDGNIREEHNFPMGRPVYEQNGVPFVYAADGETYESIALANNLFRKELLHYNDLDQDTRLDPGTVVYLQAKKNKAAKGVEKYILGPDEVTTIREIGQRFGVKESALRRLNGFTKDFEPQEGDTIILR